MRRRLAVSFRMLSPYNLARVNAAAELWDLVVIEGSRRSTTYAWEPITGGEKFVRTTLFTDQAVEEVSSGTIGAAIRRALDEHRPDVIAIPGWSFPEALAMLAWAGVNKVPVVVMSESTRHDHVRNPAREALKRWVLQFCSAALVGGEMHRQYITGLGVPADRVFFGYDAVDNGYFIRESDAARADAETLRAQYQLPARYFLLSNRFIPLKNLVRFLDAYAEYRATAPAETLRDVVLLGDGEERAMLEAQVRALGIEAHVHFPGFRQYDVLPTYYALADAFVHVSTVEPWGLVVNEAAAAGLPLVVSDRCGCVETLVEDGVNGWRIDPFDTSAIASALVRMSSPETDRAAMGRRSREIVAGWGPEAFGAGLKAAADHALANPVRPANKFERAVINALALRG